MRLPGTRLGPYEILAPVGEGGMNDPLGARTVEPAFAADARSQAAAHTIIAALMFVPLEMLLRSSTGS